MSYCYTVTLSILTQGRQMEGATKPAKRKKKKEKEKLEGKTNRLPWYSLYPSRLKYSEQKKEIKSMALWGTWVVQSELSIQFPLRS